MERLDCHVKEYAWGKCGEKSEVAQLFLAGHKNFCIGAQTPYAELWMGTHPDGPAKIRASSECLSRIIAKNNEKNLNNNNNNNSKIKNEIHLPFIMKIMSIKHTLSLQVHPTKEQASILHEIDPIHYPDRNHKPELAYALTRFELLCGFRPAEQIITNFKAFPELRKVMGKKNCENFEYYYFKIKSTENEKALDSIELKNYLRICFTSMLQMQVDRPKFVEEQLKNLYNRLDNNVRGCLTEETVKIMRDTYQRFPKDVGCFAPLYLNHLILKPGECCYYAAEELHAYLTGECVECVGCSNNTIRAGLTPKYIDRENLVCVLNYRMTDPEFYMIKPKLVSNLPNIKEFSTNSCKDFVLHEIMIPEITPLKEEKNETQTIQLPALDCPSIIVIVKGEAECEEIVKTNANNLSFLKNDVKKKFTVQRGDIFYIPSGQIIRLNATKQNSFNKKIFSTKTSIADGQCLLAYRTFSYEAGPDYSNRILVNNDLNACKFLSNKYKSKTMMSPSIIIEEINKSKKINHETMVVDQLTRRQMLFDVESEIDGFL